MRTLFLLSALLVACAASSLVSKAHVRLFSCGKLHYRTFHLDQRHDALYVGAMDRIFKLPTKDVNRTRYIQSISLVERSAQAIEMDCMYLVRLTSFVGSLKMR